MPGVDISHLIIMGMKMIEPQVDECGYRVYTYHYEKIFLDKVYYTQVDSDLTLATKKAIHTASIHHNDKLAGVIDKEFLLYGKQTNELGDLIFPITDFLYKHISNITDARCFLQDMWVNIQEKNEFNPLHDHNGKFSFVWYLDVPEAIRNSDIRGKIQFTSCLSNNMLTMNPKTNDLFIFANSHSHQVYPFNLNVTRISISGNIY